MNRHGKRRENMQSAVTLPEIMIAAALLMVMCSMLYLLFANCSFLNQFNRERTIAMSHAEYVMEWVKNEAMDDFDSVYSDIQAGNTTPWAWGSSDIAGEFDSGSAYDFIPLNDEAIDVSVPGAADVDPLDVRVTVSWTDWRTKTRSVKLDTLLTEP